MYILILIINIINNILSIQINKKKLNSNSEIKINITEKGYQNILFENFTYLPNEVIINNLPQIINNSSLYELNNCNNEIILRWNYSVPSYEFMFANSNITFINLTNFDTSNSTSMESMFLNCHFLNNIFFGYLNTSSVTSMRQMFKDCESLSEFPLNNIITSNVKDMSGMFQNCISLTYLDLHNFDMSSVSNTKDMFNNCYNLINLSTDYFNLSSVIEMNAMFYKCSKLQSLNLSKFFTSSSLNDTNSMFYGCGSLISLDLSNFNTSNVVDMNSMFKECKSLYSLDLSSFNTKSVTNMKDMFNECEAITSLNLRNFDTSLVTDMRYMFYNCIKLESLNLSNFNTSLVTHMNGMFYKCHNLRILDISSFKTKNVINMEDMFNECYSLEYLNLTNFNTKKVENMRNMFNKCEKLESLNLNNFDTSKVTDMGWMFYGCKGLKELNVNNFNTINVTNMAGMFQECRNITILHLNNFYTPRVIGMEGMFYNCTSLKAINLDNLDTSKVNNTMDMFNRCTSLIYLNLKYADTSAVQEMNAMFYDCKSLLYLYLNIFNTSNLKDSSKCNSIFDNYNSSINYCFNKEINARNICRISDNNILENCAHECFKNNSKFNNENNQCNENCSSGEYEYNNICYKSCPYGTHFKGNMCENDLLCSDYYNFDKTECLEEIPEGYYCNSSIDKTIDKCDKKCKTCSFESIQNDNKCLSCNINESYYQKYNDSSDFVECYNGILEKYFFEDNFYKSCYKTCKNCDKLGNISNHSCTECYSNYTFNNSNCYEKCEHYYYFDSNNIYHCTNISQCPNEANKLILEQKKCIKNCDDTYKYEYNNNTCYAFCPNNTFTYAHQNRCVDEIPMNYYIVDRNKSLIDKCIDKCKNCTKESLQNNNSCISCNIENGYYPIYSDILNNKTYINCYNNYSSNLNGYYLDLSINAYIKCYNTCETCEKLGNEHDHQCTSCISNYIFKNGSCLEPSSKNDCLYINKDNNECLDKCTGKDFFSYNCLINYNFNSNNNSNISNYESINKDYISAKNKDNMILNIKEGIITHSMDEILSNLTKGGKNDLIIRESDISYQITTTDNQKNNENHNISSIILGECENILKEKYKIDSKKSLLILKIDYYKPNTLIPIIGYEVFDPETKQKLDLIHCKNELIKLNIPISIDENNLFKYDPNNEYYADKCIPYTTENGLDIIIDDRQNEYNNNNMSICENNCTFVEYESDTKKSICQCGIKSKQLVISDIFNQTDILDNDFSKTGQSLSMASMKCYYTLFTKDGILRNIGSYVLLFTIFEFMISAILFYKAGYHLLEDVITNILNEKKINNNNKKKITNKKCEMETNGNIKEIQYIKSKTKGKEEKKEKNKFKSHYPPKKVKSGKEKRKRVLNNKKDTNKSFNQKSLTRVELKSANRTLIIENNSKKQKETIPSYNYNDFELNLFSYRKALKYDKRTFCSYYISLIKSKNILLLPFFTREDYNSFIIKINLFLLSFCIYYFSNTLFFNESVIHQIYIDGGFYNFIYLIPYILYSFIISHTLISIIKYFSLSERNIFEIKVESDYSKAYNIKEKVEKCLVIKYILFFVLGITFLFFLWYFLSSFGAVYHNTQIYLVKNTLISFTFELIYPFVINVLPGIFRINSLNEAKDEFMFNIGKFIQII